MASLLMLLPPIPILQYIILLILTQMPPCLSSYDYYTGCANLYGCGDITKIGFPFWGEDRPNGCGHPLLHLICHNNITYITIKDVEYQALDVNPDNHILRIARVEYLQGQQCPSKFLNTSLDPELFVYGSNYTNLTLFYGCHDVPNAFPLITGHLNCFSVGNYDEYVYAQFGALGPPIFCKTSVVDPVPPSLLNIEDLTKIQGAIIDGFLVRWIAGIAECEECKKSDGVCGYDGSSNQPTCYCRNQSSDSVSKTCSSSPNAKAAHQAQVPPLQGIQSNIQRKVIIGVTGAATAGLLICITICCCRCKSSTWQEKFWLKTESNKDIEAFLKCHGALTLKRYKFSDVRKMTNSFKVKLGQGGFGSVYKGKLLTGDPVAVKMLNASKGNGEEFINEVASISRTSHVNVVTLLGFCLEGRKKALIYEFMPSGSLEKFIYQKGSETTPSLSWDNLYQIALGIARGLEYLHRGCNTRILHFDIKPHNILLDENFCPKISDFGLAKLCPTKESIISMSDARGTMGYVAPEVWNRHFGGVSHKSDVYSYGMMLLEMVGGRKNIIAEASNTSEIYFPHWVYNRLRQGNDLKPDRVLAAEENEIAKRMTLVGLWCIQTFPNDRPAMSRVIDMLGGSMDSLEMPPKPILSSPTRSVPESSTT